jgi:malic enzyme
VVNGVGAAGVATTKLLLKYGVKDIVVVDTS